MANTDSGYNFVSDSSHSYPSERINSKQIVVFWPKTMREISRTTRFTPLPVNISNNYIVISSQPVSRHSSPPFYPLNYVVFYIDRNANLVWVMVFWRVL